MTINNAGTLSVTDFGLNAVKAETVTTINNTGTFVGSIDLEGDGKNTFYNESGGLLEVGTKFNLTSKGELETAARCRLVAPTISSQQSSPAPFSPTIPGPYLFDLEMGSSYEGNADFFAFEVSDKDVYPTGTLELNLTGSNLLSSGDSGEAFIFSSNDDIIKLSNFSVEDTATVDYSFENDQTSSSLNTPLTTPPALLC